MSHPILSGAASGVPSVPTPNTTAVLVIDTPKPGVTPQQIMAVIPNEIRATVKLYLDGKIRQNGTREATAKASSSWSTRRAGRSTNPYGNTPAREEAVNGSPIHSGWTPDAAEGIEPRSAAVTLLGALLQGGTTTFKRR